jgi:hypothetical protein
MTRRYGRKDDHDGTEITTQSTEDTHGRRTRAVWTQSAKQLHRREENQPTTEQTTNTHNQEYGVVLCIRYCHVSARSSSGNIQFQYVLLSQDIIPPHAPPGPESYGVLPISVFTDDELGTPVYRPVKSSTLIFGGAG